MYHYYYYWLNTNKATQGKIQSKSDNFHSLNLKISSANGSYFVSASMAADDGRQHDQGIGRLRHLFQFIPWCQNYESVYRPLPTSIVTKQCSWWRHQMETFSALLALCAGNSPVPVNSPHKGQWRGALMFSLIYVWINGWVNNSETGDLRRHRGHYDVIIMDWYIAICWQKCSMFREYFSKAVSFRVRDEMSTF